MKTTEHLVISVVEKDEAKRQAHNQEAERLQTIKVAQVIPPAEKEKDRLQQREDGRKLRCKRSRGGGSSPCGKG
jgi:hypothetical protein